VPTIKALPEFERIFRAHADNVDQYPHFLALVRVFTAVFVHDNLAGAMVMRHIAKSQYHKGGKVSTFRLAVEWELVIYIAS
jgi:hypothetical protein